MKEAPFGLAVAFLTTESLNVELLAGKMQCSAS